MGFYPYYSTGFPAVVAAMRSARRISFGIDSIMDPCAGGLIPRELVKSLSINAVTGLIAGAGVTATGVQSHGGLNVEAIAAGSRTDNALTVNSQIASVGIIAPVQATVTKDAMARGTQITFTANPSPAGVTGGMASAIPYFRVYPTAAQRASNWKGGDPFLTGTINVGFLINQISTVAGGANSARNMSICTWLGNDSASYQSGFAAIDTRDMYNTVTNTLVACTGTITGGANNPVVAIGRETAGDYTTGTIGTNTPQIMAYKMENAAASGCTLCFPAISSMSAYLMSIQGSTQRTAWHTFTGRVDVLCYYLGANVTSGDYTTRANHNTNIQAMIDADLAAQLALYGTRPAILLIPTHDASFFRQDPNNPVTGTTTLNLSTNAESTTSQPRTVAYYEGVVQTCDELVTIYQGLGYVAAYVNMYAAIGPAGSIVNKIGTDWQHPDATGAATWVSRFNSLMNDAASSTPTYGRARAAARPRASRGCR